MHSLIAMYGPDDALNDDDGWAWLENVSFSFNISGILRVSVDVVLRSVNDCVRPWFGIGRPLVSLLFDSLFVLRIECDRSNCCSRFASFAIATKL